MKTIIPALVILGSVSSLAVAEQPSLKGAELTSQATVIRYSLSRWEALTLTLRDGRVCIDNSAAERVMRPIAVGRRNWTFAGSNAGGERAAAIYSLIETAKLHGSDPEAYRACWPRPTSSSRQQSGLG